MEGGYRVFGASMKALSQAVPEQVIANGFDTTTVVCLSYLGGAGFRVNLEIFLGGGGGYARSSHRSKKQVELDVMEGLLSAEVAKTAYGFERRAT